MLLKRQKQCVGACVWITYLAGSWQVSSTSQSYPYHYEVIIRVELRDCIVFRADG